MKKYAKKNNPSVHIIDHGIILPRLEIENGPLWGFGGVCDSKNNFVDYSFYDGGWAKHGGYYSWNDEIYIDDEVIYIGMFFLHWGHFLIDLTNRLWYVAEKVKENPNIKVAYLGEEEPAGNNLKFFQMLGITEENLIHITEPTRFKIVYVPEQAFKSCDWYTDKFVDMFDCIVAKALSKNSFTDLSEYKKIYFSRRSFGKAVSSEFGEEYFENLFVSNGFISIAPETLSLEEQIYLWNNCEEIVCINGTIPLNVIFSKNKNLKLTVLNKTSILHENPYILLQFRDIQANFIDIFEEPFKKYPKSLGEGPFLLNNTADFQNYCKKNDLNLFQNEKTTDKYFKKCKKKYIFTIISLKNKVKGIIRKIIPKKLIGLLHKI